MNKKKLEEFKKDMKNIVNIGRLIILQKLLKIEKNKTKIKEIGKEVNKIIEEIKDENHRKI